MKEFRSNYPQVQIKLLARPYSALMAMVAAGDLDIALATRPEPGFRALEFRHLFTSDFVIITPLGHELLELPQISLHELAQWSLILLGPGTHSRQTLEQALKREGLRYEIALEMDMPDMAKRYVEIGMGIGFTYEYTVHPEDIGKLEFRKLTQIFPASPMGLITLKGKFLSRSVRNFIDTLIAHLEA